MYTDILIGLFYIAFLTIFSIMVMTIWKSCYYLRVIKELLYEIFGSHRDIGVRLRAMAECHDHAGRENEQGTDKE